MATARETRRSAPFLTADESLNVDIEARPPATYSSGTIDASELAWDQSLQARIEVGVNWNKLRETTKQARAPLQLLVISRCAKTRWSESQAIADTLKTQSNHFVVNYRLNRAPVSETVKAEVVVATASQVESTNSGAARSKLSVLARWPFKIRFERAGFEFPTKWVSFGEYKYPESALWLVNMSEESWTMPIREAVEIRLNSDAEDFYRILQSGGERFQSQTKILRTQITYDALSQILEAYLTGSAAEEEVDPDGERFCDVVSRAIDGLFDRSIEELQDLVDSDLAVFRAQLQDALELNRSITVDT